MTGDVPVGAMVSVGDVVDGALVVGLVGAVGLFVLAVAGLAATVALALIELAEQPAPVPTDHRRKQAEMPLRR